MLFRFASVFAALLCGQLVYSPAHAATLYVATNGSGVDCIVNAPCATLAAALNKAVVGDNIICISPPYVGSIIIYKTITIDCASARATFSGGGTETTSDGSSARIIVDIPPSAADPLRTVRLRGLTIDGAIGGVNNTPGRGFDRGIDVQAAAAVHIEDCIFSNFKKQGIYDHRTGGQTKLFIKDTFVSGSAGPGIVASSQGPAVTVLDNVSLQANAYGLAAASGNNVVITRSTISGNTTAGIHADGGARINVTNSVLSNNTTNVNAYGAVLLRENDVFFSNTAIAGSGAVSHGANRFAGNGAIGSAPAIVGGAPVDIYSQ